MSKDGARPPASNSNSLDESTSRRNRRRDAVDTRHNHQELAFDLDESVSNADAPLGLRSAKLYAPRGSNLPETVEVLGRSTRSRSCELTAHRSSTSLGDSQDVLEAGVGVRNVGMQQAKAAVLYTASQEMPSPPTASSSRLTLQHTRRMSHASASDFCEGPDNSALQARKRAATSSPHDKANHMATPATSSQSQEALMTLDATDAHAGRSPAQKRKHHHRAKRDPQQPPRPPNMWILYRTDARARLMEEYDEKHEKPPPESQISRILGERWKKENPQVRQAYERRAETALREHKVQYPDYKYKPQKTDDTDWTLYRRDQILTLKASDRRISLPREPDLTEMLASKWREEPPEVLQKYRNMASGLKGAKDGELKEVKVRDSLDIESTVDRPGSQYDSCVKRSPPFAKPAVGRSIDATQLSTMMRAGESTTPHTAWRPTAQVSSGSPTRASSGWSEQVLPASRRLSDFQHPSTSHRQVPDVARQQSFAQVPGSPSQRNQPLLPQPFRSSDSSVRREIYPAVQQSEEWISSATPTSHPPRQSSNWHRHTGIPSSARSSLSLSDAEFAFQNPFNPFQGPHYVENPSRSSSLYSQSISSDHLPRRYSDTAELGPTLPPLDPTRAHSISGPSPTDLQYLHRSRSNTPLRRTEAYDCYGGGSSASRQVNLAHLYHQRSLPPSPPLINKSDFGTRLPSIQQALADADRHGFASQHRPLSGTSVIAPPLLSAVNSSGSQSAVTKPVISTPSPTDLYLSRLRHGVGPADQFRTDPSLR